MLLALCRKQSNDTSPGNKSTNLKVTQQPAGGSSQEVYTIGIQRTRRIDGYKARSGGMLVDLGSKQSEDTSLLNKSTQLKVTPWPVGG